MKITVSKQKICFLLKLKQGKIKTRLSQEEGNWPKKS